MNARWVVREMKQFADIWRPIREATQLVYCGEGRRGYEDGDWAHVFAVFTLSDSSYIESWWRAQQESTLWAEAGFPEVPCYQTTYNNFRRMEASAAVIEEAAYKLVRVAMHCDDRVGRHWHVDGTAYQSPAQLEHCCPDRAACRAAGGRPPRFVRKAATDAVNDERHAEQAGPEPEDGLAAAMARGEVAPLRESDRYGELADDPRYRYVWLGAPGRRHLYRSLDKDAGTRMYNGPNRRKKVWHGGIELAAADNFTGGGLGTCFFAADEMEYDHYPALYEKVVAGIGRKPVAVVADKGLHTKGTFEHNTRRGVGTIIPWRKTAQGKERRALACDEFDEHGVPRCQYCGGGGTMDAGEGGAVNRQSLGFYLARSEPRLRYCCALGTTPNCRNRTQSIACSTEWRMLLTIGLTTELYYALKSNHKNKENLFASWRQRYRVAANDSSSRPRVRRRAHLELRAAFGLLLEWFRICLRHGWLVAAGHSRRNEAEPFQRRDRRGWLRRVLRARVRRGTALPRGRYAEQGTTLGMSLTLPGHDPPWDPGDEVDRQPPGT